MEAGALTKDDLKMLELARIQELEQRALLAEQREVLAAQALDQVQLESDRWREETARRDAEIDRLRGELVRRTAFLQPTFRNIWFAFRRWLGAQLRRLGS